MAGRTPGHARPSRRALLVGLALAGCSSAPRRAPEVPAAAAPTPALAVLAPPHREIVGAAYRRRFPVKTALDKIVTNRGAGPEQLYGTRNVRAVLNGVYYRGGANNAFHRGTPRDNHNPLPPDGLENLCRAGFGTAMYMYPTGFASADTRETCRTADGDANHLDYEQVTVLHGRRDDIRRVIASVYDHIRRPELGPIYVHCWNGWHASGYAAAATLRQFCGFSADQAVRYWDLNTDGADGPGYEKIRELIRRFTPFPEFTISADERAALCPDPETFTFRDAP
ncbi:MAG TPA: hypothetical protein VHE35_27855 [Kofleriaceae bacterium]|nr:hypothetical protein [Kofleriaceae bacterium]